MERRAHYIKVDRRLTQTAKILVESGALHTAIMTTMLITYVIGDVSLYVVFFMVRYLFEKYKVVSLILRFFRSLKP